MQARRFARVFGAVFVVVGLLGFVVTGFSGFAASSKLNLLNLNQPDNLFHFASALAALHFGLSGRRHTATA